MRINYTLKRKDFNMSQRHINIYLKVYGIFLRLILARLRTPTRAFSSCVVIKTGDSIDSISAVDMAARRYATLGAGLGIHTGDLRGKLSPIRNGAAINTGALYHAQSIERAALSCSQGGVRKGSITFHWHGLHKDFLDTVSYKNSARPDADSMKHSDHAIWINGFILHKIRNNEDIYLFDPPEVPKLWKLFILLSYLNLLKNIIVV